MQEWAARYQACRGSATAELMTLLVQVYIACLFEVHALHGLIVNTSVQACGAEHVVTVAEVDGDIDHLVQTLLVEVIEACPVCIPLGAPRQA